MHNIKTLLLLSLIFSTTITFPQTGRQVIDSLFIELEKADDKSKIEILNNISLNYSDYSYDSSLYFANEALNLSHILHDKKGIADSYNRIGDVYSHMDEGKTAIEFYNKCLAIRLELNDSKGISDVYGELAVVYNDINNYPKAIEYYQKSTEECNKRDDKKGAARNYYRAAYIYQESGNYKESIEFFLKGLEVACEIKDEILCADIYNGLGGSYYEISSYEQTLKYYLDALEIYQNNNDSSGISMIYNNVGMVYQSLQETDKALEFYQKTLQMDINLGSQYGQANAYNNIGTSYAEKGDKVKALEYYNKSLELNKEIDDKKGIATALNNIGLIYLDLGEYDKAYKNLQGSADLVKEVEDIYSLANVYNNLANLFLKQKQYDKAQTYLNNAIDLAKQIHVIEWLVESYDLYHQLYSELNNYKKALEYYQLYSEVQDSILENKSTNRIAEMKIKYETENLETENELLKKDNQIHLLELNRQKNIKNYWIAFSLLILALTVLSYSRFRLKKKTNGLLKSKNDQLRDANSKLIASEYNLKELNATKDKFFSIIAHDLKNPFQSLLGFSETLHNEMDKLNEEEITEYTRLIYESSQNLFSLLGNLLQWSKSQLESLKLDPIEINLYDSVNDVLSLFDFLINKKQIAIENSIDKELMVLADKHVLSTVLRNLISNAIKFTGPGGKIKISAVKIDDKIKVSVKDTGEGIRKDSLEKLFKIDQSHSTKGTDNESGTGLGLILCKELITQSGGEIFVDSEEKKGSNFQFTVDCIEIKSA